MDFPHSDFLLYRTKRIAERCLERNVLYEPNADTIRRKPFCVSHRTSRDAKTLSTQCLMPNLFPSFIEHTL